jgi:exosortase
MVCYAPILMGMARQWWTDEDMGHGFIVPAVVLWILWRERGRWQSLLPKPSRWGLALLALGAAMHLASAVGAGLFAGSLAFLISIAGLTVCFGGWALLRAWAFPLALCFFMLPKLAVVYNQATLPLQLLASRMAAGLLTTAGAAVIRDGNILDVGGRQILVAEACSGIRYLLPLGFMGVVIGYLADPKPWMRVALLFAAVPVAIVANAVRVAVVGWIPALVNETAHAVSGWVVFVLCLASLFLARRLFSYLHARIS